MYPAAVTRVSKIPVPGDQIETPAPDSTRNPGLSSFGI
jgi:hypothetical protein